MRFRHLLALVLVLGVVALALWQFVGRGPGGSEPVALAPGAGRAQAAGRDDAALAGAASERAERTAARAPDTAPATAARGPAVGAGAAGTAEEPTGPLLVGRVVDTSGAPVAGAAVYASDREGFALDLQPAAFGESDWRRRFEALSDDEGVFELRGPEPGEIRIAVRAAGFAPLDRSGVRLPVGERHDLGELELQSGAVLTGFVRDEDGRPVAGAEIQRQEDSPFAFFDPGSRRVAAVTDASGAFRVDQLACGPWSFRVHHLLHPDRTFEGIAEVPEETAGLDWRLERGFAVRGRVRGIPPGESDSLFVSAAPGAADQGFFFARTEQRGEPRFGDVAPDGSFAVTGLREGETYGVRLRALAGGLRTIWGDNDRSESVSVAAGTSGVELEYASGLALVLSVVDASSGAPLEDFVVLAGYGWRRALEGEDGEPLRHHPGGRVRYEGLQQRRNGQDLELRVEAVGYRTYERDGVPAPRGSEIDLGTVRLEPVPVLTVRVVDDVSGAPLENAQVSLRAPGAANPQARGLAELGYAGGSFRSTRDERNRTATTGADGLARLTGFAGESCTVAVEHDEHAPLVLEGVLQPPDEPYEVEARLRPGGSVAVTVLDDAGAPLAGARVEHRVEDDERPQPWRPRSDAVADDAGRVTFEHLADGVHRFRIAQDGPHGIAFGNSAFVVAEEAGAGADEEGWGEVAVRGESRETLELRAEARGALEGRVREAGRPLAGARIALRADGGDDDGQEWGAYFPGFGGDGVRTGSDGSYRVEDLRPGPYVLTVTHPLRAMPAERSVTVAAAGTTFDVELSVSVIEGRVTDQDGEPVEGVRVVALPERGGERGLAVLDFGGDAAFFGGERAADARTDADGRYSLRGVKPDEPLTVRVSGGSIQPLSTEDLELAPGEVRGGVDFAVASAGSVRVVVERADGTPAGFCSVRATWQSEGDVRDARSFVTGSGETTLGGLRPGTWSVEVTRPGASDEQTRQVAVVAGETAELLFRLP